MATVIETDNKPEILPPLDVARCAAWLRRYFSGDRLVRLRAELEKANGPTLIMHDTAPMRPRPKSRRLRKLQGAAKSKAADSRGESLRMAILRFLAGKGEEGATDQEIQVGLQMPGNTECPRRLELVERGDVVASGRFRQTARG